MTIPTYQVGDLITNNDNEKYPMIYKEFTYNPGVFYDHSRLMVKTTFLVLAAPLLGETVMYGDFGDSTLMDLVKLLWIEKSEIVYVERYYIKDNFDLLEDDA